MFRFDDRRWPIIVFEFEGLQTLDEHAASLRIWDHQFRRGGSFIVVRIFRDDAALVHPTGAGRITRTWLQQGAREKIRSCVDAMINVVPDSAYDSIKQKSVEEVFGVPGGVFRHPAEAVDWFNAAVGSSLNTTLSERDLCDLAEDKGR